MGVSFEHPVFYEEKKMYLNIWNILYIERAYINRSMHRFIFTALQTILISNALLSSSGFFAESLNVRKFR